MMDFIPLKLSDTTKDTTVQEDTSKTFTVPTNRLYVIDSIMVDFTTGDDAANRQLKIKISDTASNVFGIYWADTVQPASKSYQWTFAPGATAINSPSDCSLVYPIPEWWVPGGCTILIDDNTSSAVDSDFIEVHILGKLYSYQGSIA